MKTKLEFTVSVTVDHPKGWSRKEILKTAQSVIGKNSMMGSNGTDSYAAKVKSIKAAGAP